ncbi:MAG: rhomboid family intramembrane serine protease [Fluviicola sp.]|nr:rhomboid family intramembrane serine protease [Fluviicola sp.]
MLAGIPQVTKNLLLLNVLMFILTFVFESKGIALGSILGAHYFGTPLFEPYQIVSHFFMHDGIFHLFFNMYALVIFGSFLEKLWGPKRFFILYIASALGAFLLYNGMGYFHILELKAQINNDSLIAGLNGIIKDNNPNDATTNLILDFISSHNQNAVSLPLVFEYAAKSYIPMVGASGAIFGILASFAILFPNTELQLLFPPIPIKAKWLIGGYFILEVYMSFQDKAGDNVAHLAHVGGAIVGAIIVLIWRKRSNHFY